MTNLFTIADVLSVAVEIERWGGKFYSELADSSESQTEKDFFSMLAEEEKNHEAVFASMITRVGEYTPDNSEEYLAYVRDLLDSFKIFSKERKEEARVSPLGAAIAFEKDTLLFFHALEPLIPEEEYPLLKFYIEEEKSHIQKLMSFYAE